MLRLARTRLRIKVHHIIAIGHSRRRKNIPDGDAEANGQEQPPHRRQHGINQQMNQRVIDLARLLALLPRAVPVEARGAEAVGDEEDEEPDAAVDAHELDAGPEVCAEGLAALTEAVTDGAGREEGDGFAACPVREDVAAENGDGEVGRHELPGHGAALALDVARRKG